MKTYVAIVRDHSASMGNLATKACEDYNKTLEAIQQISNKETYLSVIACGYGGRASAQILTHNQPIFNESRLKTYDTSGPGTPLYDSVGGAISVLEQVSENEKNAAYLVMVITDGQENSSFAWSQNRLVSKIANLDKTGNWTFTFRVPRGAKSTIARWGVSENNIIEWDQTNKGLEQATAQNVEAVTNYFRQRNAGATRSVSFYADVAKLDKKDLSQIREATNEFKTIYVPQKDDGEQIMLFCERNGINAYHKGSAYYQLSKREKVQAYKEIAIRDKATSKIYHGVNAKRLLGLPEYSDYKLIPGDMGQYDVFIQSTSTNRKLVGDTFLLYKV